MCPQEWGPNSVPRPIVFIQFSISLIYGALGLGFWVLFWDGILGLGSKLIECGACGLERSVFYRG
mgnify:CR=1 FL=1